jgi:hypothetical protein
VSSLVADNPSQRGASLGVGREEKRAAQGQTWVMGDATRISWSSRER